MGQQDPLAEWQREGFDMFEAMMGQIEDDFVRYVFHLQVVVDEEPRRRRSATSAVQRRRRIRCRARARSRRPRRRCQAEELAGDFDDGDEAPMPLPTEPVQQQPVRVEKTPGRNEPCFCGSGKKYKLCHGR